MENIELLAPAGDLERLKIALLYKADAVYIGGKDYSLRANATNFSIKDIKYGVKYAHKLNKKVYVTVNIVLHNKELAGLLDYLKELEESNVDGIMFSDPVVLETVKKNKLKLNLFLSTQSSSLNYETALFWKNKGVKRIVLAREALEKDIIRIKEYTNLDLECFIHGAMCSSISGKCVMSNYATNRDSNRGGCAQICRWVFNTDSKYKFSMMPKDLNMVSCISDMINAGVNSFKIEGRMRSIYYIATVVSIYRNLINKILNKTITKEYTNYCVSILNRCANRESTSQFFKSIPSYKSQYFMNENEEISNQDFLGIVKSYNKKSKHIILEQRNYFKVGDIVQIFGPNIDTFEFKIEKIYDDSNNEIKIANHPKMIVKIPLEVPVYKDSMMRIKVIDIYK